MSRYISRVSAGGAIYCNLKIFFHLFLKKKKTKFHPHTTILTLVIIG